MKYKTLFRLALKAIGVWIGASNVVYLVGSAGGLLFRMLESGGFDIDLFYLGYSMGHVTGILIGLYLFFRGEWIVNLAIPSNRPYCHECGYELTGLASEGRCPECGTAFRQTV